MRALRISWIVVFALCTLILFGRAATASAASRDDLPTLSLVLARYVEAVGGRDAIEKLTTRVCTGHEIDDRPYRGPAAVDSPVEAYGKVTDRALTVVHHPDGDVRDGCDGLVGWHVSPNGIRLDDRQRRSKTAWLLDPHGALRLEEYFPGMVLTGKDVVGGRLVHVVECERDPTYYALHFDVETGLLNRIGYYWDLSDYREADGVMVPFRIARSRKGGSTTFVFDEIEHNVRLDDTLFKMPPVVGTPAAE